ncbi:MAG: radical SAM protein [Euryarchaeota archaeon]|nr:radical SAM protein [Euryarchaeota archaeon]
MSSESRFGSAAILDCYVDEPSCLGVPPYLATYPRYVAGALGEAGTREVLYRTVDQVRRDPALLEVFSRRDLLVVIGGVAVPGKYLGGTPAGPREIAGLVSRVEGPVKVFGGPLARFGHGMTGGRRALSLPDGLFDLVVAGDIEGAVFDLARGERPESINPDAWVPRWKIGRWAIRGAEIVSQHPDFPDTMCELETYRGCQWRRCSFCVEPQYGAPDMRSVEDIAGEVEALYQRGARCFRLGDQPDLFAYGARDGEGPDPEAVRHLYASIRRVAPGLRVLHMDNANPAYMMEHPGESREIAKTIVEYNTGGDVAAFGGETADPEVVKRNSLNATPEQVLGAIRLLNEVGGARDATGLPKLLPGLNFVFGLKGETARTYQLDYEFLRGVLDSGWMVRRINLRQVAPMQGTGMEKVGDRVLRKHKHLFHRWKERIRREIDHPMLQRVAPRGTVLRDLRAEAYEGNLTLARPIGSYPLLVGVPGRHPLGVHLDAAVVGHGMRSVTGVPHPLDVNTASPEALSALPGIGERRAARILARRPIQNRQEFIQALDDPRVAESVVPYTQFAA